jgi:hypothetical protein
MSDSQTTGFGKFVPGFDFLQSLAKGASETLPQIPNLNNWIAPTLNVEELDKRINELKTVHFWLDQNSKALAATVQALEVQKMTLATLKGMNFNIGEMANALKPKATESVAPKAQPVAEKAETGAAATESPLPKSAAAAGMIDPMQLWGALTQQFQQIAAGAIQEVGKSSAAAKKGVSRTRKSGVSAKTVAKKPAPKR